jgi:hypothetical protein
MIIERPDPEPSVKMRYLAQGHTLVLSTTVCIHRKDRG